MAGPTPPVPGTPEWWASVIQGDPLYGQTQASLGAEDLTDRNATQAAINRALIQYGDVGSALQAAQAGGFGGQFLQAVSPETQAAAEALNKAGLSTFAQNQQHSQDAFRGITNALAGNGILDSGETGFQYGRQNQADAQTRYGSINSLLDYLNGAQQGYLAHQATRNQSLLDAGQKAADRAASLFPGAPTTPPVPGGQALYPETVPTVPTRIVGAGVQKVPGGLVTDAAGGSYNPATSTYSLPAPKVPQPTSYSTYKTQVKVAPGQSLHFTSGKGFYSA